MTMPFCQKGEGERKKTGVIKERGAREWRSKRGTRRQIGNEEEEEEEEEGGMHTLGKT